MRKKGFVVLLTAVMAIQLFACSSSNNDGKENETQVVTNSKTGQTATEIQEKEVAVADGITLKFSKFEVNSDYDTSATTIELGEETKVTGDGAEANGANVTITKEGTYILSGTVSEGQIRVAAEKEAKVQLVLNGVEVTCTTDSPLYVESADEVVLTLADGTKNTFIDAKDYTGDGNACIYSKEDLAINGSGSLIVTGNYNNGIGSKNDLEIISGNITVTALKNGLKGNDSVAIYTGTLNLTSGKDAIKSDTEDDAAKGYVYIENADITANAGDDGIQAVNAIVYKAGNYNITCEGKKTNCETLEEVSDNVTVVEGK
jgi:lipopolysaccharide export system protein LptA